MLIPRFAIAAFALAAIGAAQPAAAQTAYAGSWKIVAAGAAPWATNDQKPDVAEAKALRGKTVVIKAASISGPRQLACPKAKFVVKDYSADMLFQGSFGEMHERDKSADPAKLAENFGLAANVKTLETGCGNEIDFHAANDKTLIFGLNNTIYRMEKQ